MSYAYLALFWHNIESQDCIKENVSKFSLEDLESLIGIITNLLITITGVCAIRYFHKLKEKSYNATFSYYSRLLVRLKKIESLLDNYRDQIIEKFLPENERSEINPALKKTFDNAIVALTSASEETLDFLRKESDQMPASRDWPLHYASLLDFLELCTNLTNEKYFNPAFVNDKKQVQKKICEGKQNIEVMIEQILNKQKDVSRKLNKRERNTKSKASK